MDRQSRIEHRAGASSGSRAGATAGLLIPAVLGLAALVLGGISYGAYERLETDNGFCLSCHTMAEAAGPVVVSAHGDLACVECHTSPALERTGLALRQALTLSDSVTAHAPVNDAACAACHQGVDPAEHLTVDRTAGHQVHLNPDDPDLAGVTCTTCHAETMHDPVPSDATCASAGCHTDHDITLAAMADFEWECATCHSWTAVVPESGSAAGDGPGAADSGRLEVARALLSGAGDGCVRCHAMAHLTRDRPPEDDPHGNDCAACHEPHSHPDAVAANFTCSNVGCHSQPDTLSAFHRGLDPGIQSDCAQCHSAHDFSVQGDDCMACHQDIFDRNRPPTGPSPHPGTLLPGASRTSTLPHLGWVNRLVVEAVERWNRHEEGARALEALFRRGAGPGEVRADTQEVRTEGVAVLDTLPMIPPGVSITPFGRFDHLQHEAVECTECHVQELRHGQLTVATATDCRTCHHLQEAEAGCEMCHPVDQFPEAAYGIPTTINLTHAESRVRTLPFDHRDHAQEDCATCHIPGLTQEVEDPGCASCHEEHHDLDRTCTVCHTPSPKEYHPPEVHMGCGGAECHMNIPFEIAPQHRNFCVTCHQDIPDHDSGTKLTEECTDCHVLPPPGTTLAGEQRRWEHP